MGHREMHELMLEEDKGGGHGGCPKQRHKPGQRPGEESMAGELGSCRRLVWLEQREEGRAEKQLDKQQVPAHVRTWAFPPTD